jgi:hypothetical protein
MNCRRFYTGAVEGLEEIEMNARRRKVLRLKCTNSTLREKNFPATKQALNFIPIPRIRF